MPGARRGEFHINFPYNAYPNLGLSRHGDGGEVGADGVEIGPHLLATHAPARLEAVHQPLGPCVNHGVGGAGLHLVGPDLVGYVDDDVAVHHGVHRLADEGQGEGETGVFLQPGQVHRHHRDIGHVRLLQGLAQQVDVVGGPATAPGLGDEQAHLVGVVAPVLHRVDELADDQQGGVAGVVVDVFETLVHNATVVGGEHIHLVALALQQLLHHAEVDGQHLGHEEGVFLLHLFGEQQASGVVIDQFCHGGNSFHGCRSCRGGYHPPVFSWNDLFCGRIISAPTYRGWQFCRGGHCPPAFNGAFWEWRAHNVRPYTRIYDSFRASIAAIRERIRIFTAPRLLISSIFSWVYSLPPSSRMERISSPVMASMPQPKLTS